MIPPHSPFPNEIEIRWLFDPEIFPFVREAVALTDQRTRPIPNHDLDGRVIVGYAIKKWGFRGAGRRRFFYIMPYDFSPEEAAWIPMEAVDPLSVSPGVAGKQNARCRALPTSEQSIAIEAILEERRVYLQRKRALAAARQRKHRTPSPEQIRRDARNTQRRARYAEQKKQKEGA